MNELLPSAESDAAREPDPAMQAPAAGSEAAPGAPLSFGDTLRAAREAAGISVATLAGRLRLHVKQIDALERADLAALPTLIYVRGFVRSCARELKLDPLPLLADLDRRAGVIVGAPLAPAGGSFPLARLGDGSRSVVAIAIVVLIIAGIVGTLWPRRAAVAPPPSSSTPVTPLADPAPAAAPAPDVAGAQAPDVAAAPSPAPAAAAGDVSAAAAPHAPAAPAKATAGKPEPASAVATPAPPPAVPEAPAGLAAAAALPDADGLVLHVHAPSWVEVVQANGTSVFSQICPAGSVQNIHGVAPLRVVVGNAAAVDAQYHGAPVDLNRYANVNGVARLTLQ